MAGNMDPGNVVKDYYIFNTHVKICDDYCRDRPRADIEAILARISHDAQKQLSAPATIC